MGGIGGANVQLLLYNRPFKSSILRSVMQALKRSRLKLIWWLITFEAIVRDCFRLTGYSCNLLSKIYLNWHMSVPESTTIASISSPACVYSQLLRNFSLILPDISCTLLLGNSLQSGSKFSSPNAFAKLNSARQVLLLILSHSSLVGKTTLWARQEMIGNPYRQRNGTASCSHLSVANWAGIRNWLESYT